MTVGVRVEEQLALREGLVQDPVGLRLWLGEGVPVLVGPVWVC